MLHEWLQGGQRSQIQKHWYVWSQMILFSVLWGMIDNKSQKVKRKCHGADSSDLANPRTRPSILGWKPRWDVTGTILGPGGDSSTGRWQEMWKKCQPGGFDDEVLLSSLTSSGLTLSFHNKTCDRIYCRFFSFWPQTVTSALDPIRIKTTPGKFRLSSPPRLLTGCPLLV